MERLNLLRPAVHAIQDQGVLVKCYEAIDFCHLIERLGEPS